MEYLILIVLKDGTTHKLPFYEERERNKRFFDIRYEVEQRKTICFNDSTDNTDYIILSDNIKEIVKNNKPISELEKLESLKVETNGNKVS